MRPIDGLLILCTAFVWGLNFVAIRWGLDEMPPLLFTGLRFLMVVIPAIFFIPKPKARWRDIFLLGLFISTLQFSLLFTAMTLGLPAGIASLLMQIQVIFTLMLSALIYKDRPTRMQIMGVMIAFIGFAALILGENLQEISLFPFILALIGAFSWATGNLVYKKTGDANRFHLTIYSALVAPLPMFVLSYIFESHTPFAILSDVSVKAWLSLGFNAYLSTILAYGIWGTMLGKYPSAMVAPFSLLVPVFGMSSAYLFLGEGFTSREILATILILLGLILCILGDAWLKRRKRSLA